MGGVKMETLTIGDVRVSWLNGGDNHLDGELCLVLYQKSFGLKNTLLLMTIVSQ